MKHRVTLVFLAFFFGLFLFSLSTSAKAQAPADSVLFKTVMALDRQLFEEGFNQCRLDRFETLSAPDLEFFHDKGGRQNRAEFLQASRTNICGNRNGRPVRTLLPGSTQVFPLENNGVLYGAIQQGVHRFHTQGQDPLKNGYTEARFSHVWILNKGRWQLKTALSFDHQQKFEKLARVQPVKKPMPKPYTIFSLNIAPYILSLEQQTAN